MPQPLSSMRILKEMLLSSDETLIKPPASVCCSEFLMMLDSASRVQRLSQVISSSGDTSTSIDTSLMSASIAMDDTISSIMPRSLTDSFFITRTPASISAMVRSVLTSHVIWSVCFSMFAMQRRRCASSILPLLRASVMRLIAVSGVLIWWEILESMSAL